MPLHEDLLSSLSEPANTTLISGILRGIEKESLRITPQGTLAQTAHPQTLGSALTHPQITTDYSEALLEFITPPSHRVEEVLCHLKNVHSFTSHQLDNEYLWATSMPCILQNDHQIPVAQYGNSNAGKMKTIYRLGLGHRYSRLMQTISGVHYNFSLPIAFWAYLHNFENSSLDLQSYRTQRYFDLIRNFRRYFWLLIYLFGASPAVCYTFLRDREHSLIPFEGDKHTMHSPYGTSLRMGNLGYQSSAQESLLINYNNLGNYLSTLCEAITDPHPDYETMGLKSKDGEYKQLNTSLLQIENEFYSSIRPKRTNNSGETALGALFHRGVEYIEVRCLDVNPYEPLGINTEQIHFLDTFLLYCLLRESPASDNAEYRHILENQKRIVYSGRDPELTLLKNGKETTVPQWGKDLLNKLVPVAQLLDTANKTQAYTESLTAQREKIENPELTPSARILADMKENQQTFYDFALSRSLEHHKILTQEPLPQKTQDRFELMSRISLEEQKTLESARQLPFDEYLANYYEQYNYCKCELDGA